jgi:kinesin family protein 22
MALKQHTADDVNCPPSLEPNTPVEACHIVEKIPVGTPLDKFNALGSNLKVLIMFLLFYTSATCFSSVQVSKYLYLTQESLIQQYLEFLNVANK